MGIGVTAMIFFFIEIAVTTNAVYRDENLKLHVGLGEIWKNWFMTWFLVDLIAWGFSIYAIAIQNIRLEGAVGKDGQPYIIYNQNSRYWRLFDLLRLLKLLSVWRMQRIACAFTGDPRRPQRAVLMMLKIFAALITLMFIVMTVLAIINASDVDKKIASIPYTELNN